ncbi:hypothetical protein BB560_002998 [Smittium megazygosporum]|uniref:NudC domain-containing protein 1 n=1 Tax=Smittium megazygosporum TaxID=133381 RepID=A0A2T9ZDD3_9FUNG|nr:hypothetical protein BB560_002998 [Smittium megazygosporum]
MCTNSTKETQSSVTDNRLAKGTLNTGSQHFEIHSFQFSTVVDDTDQIAIVKLHSFSSKTIPKYIAYTHHNFDYIVGSEEHLILEKNVSETCYSNGQSPSQVKRSTQGNSKFEFDQVENCFLSDGKCRLFKFKTKGLDTEDFPYSWTQSSDEIKLYIELPFFTESESIVVDFSSTSVSISINQPVSNASSFTLKESTGKSEFKMFDLIDSNKSSWRLQQNNLLILNLKKLRDTESSNELYMKWPYVFNFDDEVLESTEPEKLKMITKRLDMFTSSLDEPIKGQNVFGNSIFSEIDEVIDTNSENMTFSLFEGKSGALIQTFQSKKIGTTYICQGFSNTVELENSIRTENPDLGSEVHFNLPNIVLKYDVDGLVFDIKSVISPNLSSLGISDIESGHPAEKDRFSDVLTDRSENNTFDKEPLSGSREKDSKKSKDSTFDTCLKLECKHSKTINALDYVLASKREKKFVYSDHLSRYVVVAESRKRIYIYWSGKNPQSHQSVQNVVEITSSNANSSEDNSIYGILPIRNGDYLAIACKHSIFIYKLSSL